MPSDLDIAFPRLSREQIDALRPRGAVRRTTAGDVLWHAGDNAKNVMGRISDGC